MQIREQNLKYSQFKHLNCVTVMSVLNKKYNIDISLPRSQMKILRSNEVTKMKVNEDEDFSLTYFCTTL